MRHLEKGVLCCFFPANPPKGGGFVNKSMNVCLAVFWVTDSYDRCSYRPLLAFTSWNRHKQITFSNVVAAVQSSLPTFSLHTSIYKCV